MRNKLQIDTTFDFYEFGFPSNHDLFPELNLTTLCTRRENHNGLLSHHGYCCLMCPLY
jgi:hypothetical protein